MIKTGLFVFTTLLTTLVITSCNKDNSNVLPTISQTVVSLENLSQLEFAAVKGNLVAALSNKNTAPSSDGNYTIFAPTDEAFEKIGLVNSQDLNALQNPFLINVLKYHLRDGSTDDMLTNGSILTSLVGPSIKKKIIFRGTDKYVNGSKIIVTNTKADSGTIHIIDRVLLASGTDIANTAIFFAQGKGFVNPELSFLAEAVVYCDLVGALADPNANYTIFAPTNQAFKDLGKLLGLTINQPSDIRNLDKATVTQVLLTHVISGGGRFTSELYAGNLSALNGKNVALGANSNGLLSVKGPGNAVAANMVIPDVQTTNGVVHVIDRVLLP